MQHDQFTSIQLVQVQKLHHPKSIFPKTSHKQNIQTKDSFMSTSAALTDITRINTLLKWSSVLFAALTQHKL